MPTYEKLPSGKWRARVRVTPFPERSITHARKADAELWAVQEETRLKQKQRAGLFDEEVYTWAELIDDFIENELPDYNDKRQFKQQALWWRTEIGHLTLAQTRTYDIAEKRDKLLREPVYRVDVHGSAIGRVDKETGKPKFKSKATVRKYLARLSIMCSYNITHRGWLKSNPVIALSKSRKKKKRKNERARFLTDEERVALLSACQNDPNRLLYPIVMFALLTGARQSEILSLPLKNLDVACTSAILEDTKNGDSRTVYIVSTLRVCLRDYLQWLNTFHGAEGDQSQWLFPREDAVAPIAIRSSWDRAKEEAVKEVPSLADFRFHDLRHTFASYLAMSGATLVELMHALGHRSLAAVQRYAHLAENHSRPVICRMEQQRFGDAARASSERANLKEAVSFVLQSAHQPEAANDSERRPEVQQAVVIVLEAARERLKKMGSSNNPSMEYLKLLEEVG